MRAKQIVILIWAVALLCVIAPIAGKAAPASEERRAKWLTALQGEDWEVGRRALEEILADGTRCEPLTDTLVSLCRAGPRWADFFPDLVADALRERLTPSRCEELLFSDQSILCDEVVFPALLGMGKEGKAYIPLLKKVVAAEEGLTARTVKSSITLANLGWLVRRNWATLSPPCKQPIRGGQPPFG